MIDIYDMDADLICNFIHLNEELSEDVGIYDQLYAQMLGWTE